MPRQEQRDLNVPYVANEAGIPLNVEDLRDKWIQFHGAFGGGSVTVQGDSTGVVANFAPIGSAVSAPGLVEIPPTVKWIRLVAGVTPPASTAKASMNGFNERAQ